MPSRLILLISYVISFFARRFNNCHCAPFHFLELGFIGYVKKKKLNVSISDQTTYPFPPDFPFLYLHPISIEYINFSNIRSISYYFSSDLDHHPFLFPVKNFSNIRSISLPTFHPIFTIILFHSQLKIFQTSDQYILIHFSSDLDHHPFPFPVKNINTQNNVEINVSIQLDSKVYHSFLSLFSDPESKGRHFNHERVNKNRVT